MDNEFKPPTLPEWIAANPGCSINDYYKVHPVKREAVVAPTYQPYTSPSSTVSSYRTLITSAIVCSIGFIGYFCPWFSIPVLKLSMSGHEVMQIVNFLVDNDEELAHIKNYVKLLYLIPVSYVFVVLGTAIRSYLITGLATILNILIVAGILKLLFEMSPETLNMISYGIYLIVISALGLIYNIFTIRFTTK